MLNDCRQPIIFSCTVSLLCAFALLAGCAKSPNFEAQIADLSNTNKVLQDKNHQLTADLASSLSASAELQLELVEKEAEIAQLKRVKGHQDPKEVGPALRVPPPGNKVEAIIYLAEVETEVSALRGAAGDEDKPAFLEADRLLTKGKDELAKDNIDKASILAAEAMALVKSPPAEPAAIPAVAPAVYTEFVCPVQLELAKRSNIRQKPGLRGKIIDTFDLGTAVTAIGYTGKWIKVILTDGTEGWVYHILLKVPSSLPTTTSETIQRCSLPTG